MDDVDQKKKKKKKKTKKKMAFFFFFKEYSLFLGIPKKLSVFLGILGMLESATNWNFVYLSIL